MLDSTNYESFRECVFSAILENHINTSQKSKKPGALLEEAFNPAELSDFSDYIAEETFTSLPVEIVEFSHRSVQEDDAIQEKWTLPLTVTAIEEIVSHVPINVNDTLVSYGLIKPPETDLETFFMRVMTQYIAIVTTPPPKWIETKTTDCEICGRDWVPLTYHHLIPKQTHAKVLKRGWHQEQALNSVAWLCRACHSFVHKMASNEELAKQWFTVERICEREDVQRWANWVGRVRWKKT